jgi:hypothetical protein
MAYGTVLRLCRGAYALNDDSIVPKNRRAPEQITCAAECSQLTSVADSYRRPHHSAALL